MSIKEEKGVVNRVDIVGEKDAVGRGLTSGLTVRVLIVSLAAILIVAISNPKILYYVRQRIPGDIGYWNDGVFLNSTAVFIMLVMMIVTFFIQKIGVGKRFAFSRAEIITCYLMVTIGTAMTTFGSEYIFTIMQFPRYFWGVNDIRMSIHYNEMSPLIVPKDEQAVMSFLAGEAPVPWGAWLAPIIMYTLLGLALFFVMMFLVSIVRKEWEEVQRLQYPLILPIIEMTHKEEKGSFFGGFWRNKLAFGGIGIAIFVGVISQLNRYFPAFPGVSLLIKPYSFLSEGDPFKEGLGAYPQLNINFQSPLLLGVGYLVSSQILFSIWFFGFLYKMWYVGISAFGWYGGWGAAWYKTGEGIVPLQKLGAAVGLSLSFLWLSRGHLKEMLVSMFRGDSQKVDFSNEPLSPRAAIIGGILGFAYIVFFHSVLGYGGFFWVIFYFATIFIFAFVIMRLRAQVGLPLSSATGGELFTGVNWFIPNETIGEKNIAFYGAHYFTYTYNPIQGIAASLLEGFTLGDDERIRRRSLTKAMGIAFVVGLSMGLIFALPCIYKYGGDIRSYQLNRPLTWVKRADSYYIRENSVSGLIFYFGVIGVGITMLFTYLQSILPWWPFHPIGYFLATYANTSLFYISHFFLAWLIKTLILRYGGNKAFQQLRPIFIGLIIGDVLVSTFWSVVAILVGK